MVAWNNSWPHSLVSVCLTESPGFGFEAVSPQILWGEGLPRFFSSPDPNHVGASGSESAILSLICIIFDELD